MLAVCALPALVLGALAARGGWYTDDLDFLIQGRRGFGVEELLTPVNDHIVPGLRVMYAVFALVDGPSYTLTVVVRMLLWWAAVALMAGLVLRLTRGTAADRAGRGTWPMWLAIGIYGFSSLVMPSFMSLSSAVNTLPAHVLGLVLLHASLDWFEGARASRLLVVGVSLVLSMAFWEKSGLIVLTAAAVVLVARTGASDRRRWLPWLATVAVAAVGYGTAYLTLGQDSVMQWPGTGVVIGLVGEGIARTVLPAAVGGPWTWRVTTPPYFGLADPSVVIQLLGALVVLGLVVVAARSARRVLWLWAAVVLFAVVGVPVVAVGRYTTFGDVLTRHHHYWSDAAIPLTLAVVCTVASVRPTRRLMRAGLAAGLVWVLGALVSTVAFAGPWGRNPSREYLATVTAQIEDKGHVVLWDTHPPTDVMPYISTHRRMSDLVELTGLTDVEFGSTTLVPEVVNDLGEVRSATLRGWAGTAEPTADCRYRLRGAGRVVLPLNRQLDEADWAVRVGYLANPASRVRASLLDGRGHETRLLGPTQWTAGLTAAYLLAPEPVAAHAVVLTTDDPNANICIGDVAVGLLEVSP